MDGGVDQGPRFQERVGGGWSKFRSVVFLLFLMSTKKKMALFLRLPTRAGLVDGGVN